MILQAEYIWLDGTLPSQSTRSKTRMVEVNDRDKLSLADFPKWNYDGSSTYQADGKNSDLFLEPVCFVNDPIRGGDNVLVLCEVFNPDGTPHKTNYRATLREVLNSGARKNDPWFGFEQEYTLFQDNQPLGWPKGGYPAPQGPFYCGVGPNKVYGRDVVETHSKACIDAGLMLYGINAEVMPGQWEFQIGHRGFNNETGDPLTVSDHLWLARWLLHRVCEEFNIVASFEPKPIKGDWNGAGAHANFSTKTMRETGGVNHIKQIIKQLEAKHDEHIKIYGDNLASRLTGLHETCSINEFRAGVADRGASIRIPHQVEETGYGYLEDRRPGANCCPYQVCAKILDTIMEESVIEAVA
jgi:glutamine synthetase